MLVSLKISNIALIEDVEIQFNRGLNILSGETGAGKSIILDSIALISGEYAKTELIRTGEDQAKILAIFYLDHNPQLKQHLQELGIDTQENLLIIERQFFRDKRPSIAFINHNRILVGALKTIGQFLLDIHSQHENQILFDSQKHLSILDMYTGLKEIVEEYQKLFLKAIEMKKQIQQWEQQIREQEEQESFIRYQYEELSSAELDITEWDDVKTKLLNFKSLQEKEEYLQHLYNILYEQDHSAINQIQEALFLLERNFADSEELQDAQEGAKEALIRIEELVERIRTVKNSNIFSEETLSGLKQRYDLLQDLQNKYRKNIPELIELMKNLEEKLSQKDHIQEQIEQMEKERESLKDLLVQKAQEISTQRHAGALKLKDAVQKELGQLHLLHTEFDIEFKYVEDPQGIIFLPNGKRIHLLKDGMEKIQFLVSFNPGEEKKPLVKVGSGGEVGRFMLVLKKILGQLSPITTQIFDEIDSGIGGETALAVGKKILEISQQRQVICITHLPQIAAMGEIHYLVTKTSQEGRTHTHIMLLEQKQRVMEISRMLSGDSMSEVSLEHAKELLNYHKIL